MNNKIKLTISKSYCVKGLSNSFSGVSYDYITLPEKTMIHGKDLSGYYIRSFDFETFKESNDSYIITLNKDDNIFLRDEKETIVVKAEALKKGLEKGKNKAKKRELEDDFEL